LNIDVVVFHLVARQPKKREGLFCDVEEAVKGWNNTVVVNTSANTGKVTRVCAKVVNERAMHDKKVAFIFIFRFNNYNSFA
jgi:hypothetical protein